MNTSNRKTKKGTFKVMSIYISEPLYKKVLQSALKKSMALNKQISFSKRIIELVEEGISKETENKKENNNGK